MENLICGRDNPQGVESGRYDEEGQLVDPDQVLGDGDTSAVPGGPKT